MNVCSHSSCGSLRYLCDEFWDVNGNRLVRESRAESFAVCHAIDAAVFCFHVFICWCMSIFVFVRACMLTCMFVALCVYVDACIESI